MAIALEVLEIELNTMIRRLVREAVLEQYESHPLLVMPRATLEIALLSVFSLLAMAAHKGH